MSLKKKRRGSLASYEEVDLNIMPFIDVFSILNTFLLMAAVFISIGLHEIQVPFFTSSKPEKKEPTRAISLRAEIGKTAIVLRTDYNLPPKDEQKFDYDTSEAGLANYHKKLLDVRAKNPTTDLITMFIDDDVNYELITNVLDNTKLVFPEDPPLNLPPSEEDKKNGVVASSSGTKSQQLYPKVVFGSVVL